MNSFQLFSIKYIKLQQDIIDQSKFLIQEWGTKNIPDFHWMDYRISTFWKCEDSPVGMCVFKLNQYGEETYCRYCNNPMERK